MYCLQKCAFLSLRKRGWGRAERGGASEEGGELRSGCDLLSCQFFEGGLIIQVNDN